MLFAIPPFFDSASQLKRTNVAKSLKYTRLLMDFVVPSPVLKFPAAPLCNQYVAFLFNLLDGLDFSLISLPLSHFSHVDLKLFLVF